MFITEDFAVTSRWVDEQVNQFGFNSKSKGSGFIFNKQNTHNHMVHYFKKKFKAKNTGAAWVVEETEDDTPRIWCMEFSMVDY